MDGNLVSLGEGKRVGTRRGRGVGTGALRLGPKRNWRRE